MDTVFDIVTSWWYIAGGVVALVVAIRSYIKTLREDRADHANFQASREILIVLIFALAVVLWPLAVIFLFLEWASDVLKRRREARRRKANSQWRAARR